MGVSDKPAIKLEQKSFADSIRKIFVSDLLITLLFFSLVVLQSFNLALQVQSVPRIEQKVQRAEEERYCIIDALIKAPPPGPERMVQESKIRENYTTCIEIVKKRVGE